MLAYVKAYKVLLVKHFGVLYHLHSRRAGEILPYQQVPFPSCPPAFAYSSVRKREEQIKNRKKQTGTSGGTRRRSQRHRRDIPGTPARGQRNQTRQFYRHDHVLEHQRRAQGGIILGLEDIDNALAACLSRLDAIGRLVDEIDVIAAESR